MKKVLFTGETRWAGCSIEDEIVEFDDDVSDDTIEEAWLDWYLDRTGGGGSWEVVE